MVKGMAEFHGGDQLDKSRELEGFHFGTLPSRWQKWDFKTKCAGERGHHLPSKPCPWVCCCVFWPGGSGWAGMGSHPPEMMRVMCVAGMGLVILHLCSCLFPVMCQVPLSPSVHFPGFLCQPCCPLGVSTFFPSCLFSLLESSHCGESDLYTLCSPDVLTEWAGMGFEVSV